MKARFFGQHFFTCAGEGRSLSTWSQPAGNRRRTEAERQDWSLHMPLLSKAVCQGCAFRARRTASITIWIMLLVLVIVSSATKVSANRRFKNNLYLKSACVSRGCSSQVSFAGMTRNQIEAITDFRKHLGRQMQQRRIKRGWYSWGGGARMRPRIRMISACWSERFQALGSLFR